ncbi:MAG: HipA N-terminal domain-containing protein [Candidatus Omnitrophica bacterium]|nr:HipA N-terminal domain-containing protein [Candidatus Omnitrophota bacterium]
MPRGEKRRAKVFFGDRLAGVLEETDQGYRFAYDPDYVLRGPAISLSLPLRKEPYESSVLFPFFGGLNAEGWYRDIVCATKKIDPADEFGILLVSGDTAGSVTVRKSGPA